MGTSTIASARVLLVEDNPADADLVRIALNGAGSKIELQWVDRLSKALDRLAAGGGFDAVLLDLHLPDALGVEGVDRLHAAWPDLAIVVLTGAGTSAGLDALSAGAQDYLAKVALDGRAIERAMQYAIERQRHARKSVLLAQERAARQAAEANAKLLQLSFEVAEAALTEKDLKASLRLVVRRVRAGFDADSAMLLLTDEKTGELVITSFDGLDAREGERVPIGAGVAGAIASSGNARIVDDLSSVEVVVPQLRQLSGLIGAPLRLGDRVIGVLHVGSKRPRRFSADELRLLDALCGRVALVIENTRLRERARFEEERWRTVVDNMLEMVVLADRAGEIAYANPAARRWAAIPEPAMPGRGERVFYRGDGSPYEWDELPVVRAARYGEVARDVEVGHRIGGGELQIASWSASPIRDEAGGVTAAVAIGRDITALKRSEQALLEADRRKNEFLAVLSHELRNPLAPVRNSLFVLGRARPGSDQARRAQVIIGRQVDHMARLIEDLLDVTRITRGKVQLQRERLDLRALVQRTAEDHRSVFGANGVLLEVSAVEEPVWVKVDGVRMSQIVGNLLLNAAKFTPRGGLARVSLSQDDGKQQAVIRVRDSGVGISPEMLPKLFEAFSQADRTLDRSRGGLGLGLALVKGLVELHGGEVAACSDGLGQGAAFEVRVPLDSGEPTHAGRTSDRRTNSAQRVLVIEDNLDAASSLKEALEVNGHIVEVAYTGSDGLEKARAFGPDVVLCDLGLPEMDGFEVARRLRTEPQLSTVRLLAVSGYASPDDISKALRAGFDGHVAKPPDLDCLERMMVGGPDHCGQPAQTWAAALP